MGPIGKMRAGLRGNDLRGGAAPDDPYVAVLLDQNIAGEPCAISTCNALTDTTQGKDMVTCNMAPTILDREVEHDQDLQGLKEDLDLRVSRGAK